MFGPQHGRPRLPVANAVAAKAFTRSWVTPQACFSSGVTNPEGPGCAIDLGEIDFDEAAVSGTQLLVVDSLGGEDGDEPENAAAGKWYSYSFITHIVSTKPNAYVFRTGGEFDALVQFDSYYCEDEEAGCITFRYRLVPAAERSS